MDKEKTSPAAPGKLGIIRFARSSARRALRAAQYGLAHALRGSVPFFEKVWPAVGRKMCDWGWIWQPTYGHQWLNDFYNKEEDPYHFEGTSYEKGKYDHTMRLLGGRRYDRALEIGAAEGVFTEILASICESLTGIEVAEVAVERAQKRLAEYSNITFIQAALPNQMPSGKFDLIVASDVLYYFPKDVVLGLLERFEVGLNPEGIFFALHYLGDFRQASLGRDVHDLMKSHTSLELIHEETVEGVGPRDATAGYTVAIFKKTSGEK